MKIAQIQMRVTSDKTENLRRAAALIRQAAPADMAVLPEMFCCPYDNSCFRAYGEAPGGEAYQFLSALAREKRLWLVGGSVPELTDGRVYNTSYVFNPSGSCVARHRKMHLFDIDVPGGQSCIADLNRKQHAPTIYIIEIPHGSLKPTPLLIFKRKRCGIGSWRDCSRHFFFYGIRRRRCIMPKFLIFCNNIPAKSCDFFT